jgi:hypothetical protein
VIRISGRGRVIGGAFLTTALLVACGTATPTASPGGPGPSAMTPPGVLGRDWGRAAWVEQPPGDPLATTPPYDDPGSLGHPGHYQGGMASVRDVAAGGPGFVGVGYILEATGPMATAWASPDGQSWTLRSDFPGGDGSVAWGVATTGATAVAVGVVNGAPAAWYSADGVRWTRAAAPRDGPDRGELRAVVASKLGFLAAGSDEHGRLAPEAVFWTSTDGRTWERVADSAEFAAARVEGLAAQDGGVVAVGTSYAGQDASGAVSWRSEDAKTWRRSPVTRDLSRGEMHAVAASGRGLLAVGADLTGHRALVWSSRDGLAWTLAPDATALDNYGLQIEMRDVVRLETGDIAVGHLVFGTQYPTGLVWQSTDGTTWTRAPAAAVLEQVKFAAVTGGRGWAIAVGDIGGPDAVIPSILLSPWPP